MTDAIRHARRLVPQNLRDRLRPVARRLGLALPQGAWDQAAVSPWLAATPTELAAPAWCVICRWQGTSFTGGAHSELAFCPQCGSVARDRFLFWCFTSRTPEPAPAQLRVIETSPRLGEPYRRAMGTWFSYRTTDYDGGSHRGDLTIDLQDIALPDASLDVMLSSHVLEHVPDTERALAEILRVLRPGGRLVLLVPVLQAQTAPPAEPEFHEDAARVFWRLGFDLTERLERVGFRTTLLATDDWLALVDRGSAAVAGLPTGDIDLTGLIDAAPGHRFVSVADPPTAARLGFAPSWMFFAWECLRPA